MGHIPSQIEIPLIFIDVHLLRDHARLQLIQVFFPHAASNQFSDCRYQEIHRLYCSAILNVARLHQGRDMKSTEGFLIYLIQFHVERLDLGGIVRDENRLVIKLNLPLV